MNVQQLTEQFTAARNLVETYKSRGVDQETLNSAINDALNIKAKLDRARADANITAEINRLTGEMGMTSTGQPQTGGRYARGGGLGDQFVASETYQWLKTNRGKLPNGPWNSPSSELAPFTMQATLIDESSGAGGPTIVPQYLPTIQPLPQRPLRLADLLANGTADSNSIVYIREKTFTNAAAATTEGAAKPESTLVFEAITELVRKIATFVPVSEELLEDVGQMRSYLNQRLSLGVDLALDDELLNGSGVAPHLNGFVNRTGLTATQARGADNNADAILKQIGAIQAAVFMRPDGIVMHPTNWQTILLSKDANGRYYGDSPFSMVGALSLWGQPVSGTPTPTLWNLPVAITPQITAGTALVGCFKTQAMLFHRGNLRVESTNSHNDFFQKNLIAVRAELRAALGVFRPLGFGFVSGLS